ncbi:hypothetical protein GCM10023089_02410 [Quisquiliibacterium transsilvanicum]|uniref:Uncharacterized protein n=1 Tax=Quisquiliibacterium transsilvanicum TaxID=1549638 RepID=A0A7W8HGD6_9BURK|nr:hypothetical protein [Quisquiliibacterium transsilvanicum]
MTCPACIQSSERPHCGAYRFQCLECCARLVLSAYPSKPHAAGMLAAIERFPGNPGRARVLESVRLGLEKRRSATPRSNKA